jgi:hypothetical protein
MKTPSLVELYGALVPVGYQPKAVVCLWMITLRYVAERRTILYGDINKVLDHEAGDHEIVALND